MAAGRPPLLLRPLSPRLGCHHRSEQMAAPGTDPGAGLGGACPLRTWGTCRAPVAAPALPRCCGAPGLDSSASVLLNLGLAILHCEALPVHHRRRSSAPLWPPQACSIAQPPVITARCQMTRGTRSSLPQLPCAEHPCSKRSLWSPDGVLEGSPGQGCSPKPLQNPGTQSLDEILQTGGNIWDSASPCDYVTGTRPVDPAVCPRKLLHGTKCYQSQAWGLEQQPTPGTHGRQRPRPALRPSGESRWEEKGRGPDEFGGLSSPSRAQEMSLSASPRSQALVL